MEKRFMIYQPNIQKISFLVAWIIGGGATLWSESFVVDLDPYIVQSRHRYPEPHVAFSGISWTMDAIDSVVPLGVDEVFHLDPSFSFYRRQDARFANPTIQGVSLRNIGSSAAGRSLVLKNGIPQNDPFGGWVYWARYDPGSIRKLSILPSSQVTSWGNLSAGGVVSIDSVSLPRPFSTSMSVGSFETFSASIAGSMLVGTHTIDAGIRRWESEGDYVVHPDDRGRVDDTAAIRSTSVELTFELLPGKTHGAELNLSSFTESRSNGTALADNATDAKDVSVRYFIIQSGDVHWCGTLYYQQRDFENTFTSVNATRTAENRVNHQFDVPGRALGGSFMRSQSVWNGWEIVSGFDFRSLSGEVNEDFGWGLNMRRTAGGKQRNIGGFLKGETMFAQSHVLALSLRLDHWSLRDGFRKERDLVSGESLIKAVYPEVDGAEPSVSIQYRFYPSNRLQFKWSASRAFRLPTVNELYRPFRVRNDITEANPSLRPEQFLNTDLGVEWKLSDAVSWNVELYHYWIKDSIANVYQFDGPAVSVGGFIPEGGTFSQKENVPRSTVLGVESNLTVLLNHVAELKFSYLYSRAKFDEHGNPAGIAGKWFPQIPASKATLQGRYRLLESIDLFATVTIASDQYDDSLNKRVLEAYHQFDLSAVWKVADDIQLSCVVRNLTDELILTGRSSSGIRSVAPGRYVGMTLRLDF